MLINNETDVDIFYNIHLLSSVGSSMTSDPKPFKVDVDALFGEQAVRENEHSEALRRGTRRQARRSSLTHGRSFASLQSHHIGMSVDEVADFERSEMSKAETEQRQTDNFWGFDKEAIDGAHELENMIREDEYSQALEAYHKTSNQQKLWREDEELRLARERKNATANEENARNVYLKSFYASQISGDIMKFKWPTRPEVKCDEDLAAADLAASNHDGSRSRARTAGDFEIWTLEGEPSTIHLDGLQQSRTITLSGETYDPRKIASIADLAMRPAGTRSQKGSQGSHTRPPSANVSSASVAKNSPTHRNSPVGERGMSPTQHSNRRLSFSSGSKGLQQHDNMARYIKGAVYVYWASQCKYNTLNLFHRRQQVIAE